jgi:uncharacterized membrane protein
MTEDDTGRDEIHIISRNSNWSEQGIKKTFHDSGVYASRQTWQKFLNFFLIGLGASFVLAGILFFFAFNWADLHKFVKLGLIEFLIVASVTFAFLRKNLDERIRNIILSAASVLVGILFAVFGQIYQTGANAYDFFLGWTLAIALWAIVSGFPVLWFIFILLCNTSLCLYYEQVMSSLWEPPELINILFVLNVFFIVVIEVVAARKLIDWPVRWLTRIMIVASVAVITFSVCGGITSSGDSGWGVSCLLAVAGFAGGMFYGMKTKDLLYPAIIPFAVLIILLTLIVQPLHDPIGIFLVISIFIAGFTTLLIMQLVKLNKRWHAAENE